jgi:hypothetical protein
VIKSIDLLIVVVTVFASTFFASLMIRLFMSKEASLFTPVYYLVGLTLPLIQLFFEHGISRKKILVSGVGFPLIMTFFLYWMVR